MKLYNNIDELVADIQANDGILTVSMSTLKEAYDVKRLGVNVIANITSELASRGVSHMPVNLPNYQHEVVRLYKLGSPIAQIISAVTELGDAHDQKLRSLAASNAEEKLRKVREIVGD